MKFIKLLKTIKMAVKTTGCVQINRKIRQNLEIFQSIARQNYIKLIKLLKTIIIVT